MASSISKSSPLSGAGVGAGRGVFVGPGAGSSSDTAQRVATHVASNFEIRTAQFANFVHQNVRLKIDQYQIIWRSQKSLHDLDPAKKFLEIIHLAHDLIRQDDLLNFRYFVQQLPEIIRKSGPNCILINAIRWKKPDALALILAILEPQEINYEIIPFSFAIGATPLQYPIYLDDSRLLYQMLKCPKVDVNFRDSYGRTILDCASGRLADSSANREEADKMVKLLLDFGAKKGAELPKTDSQSVVNHNLKRHFLYSIKSLQKEKGTLTVDEVLQDSRKIGVTYPREHVEGYLLKKGWLKVEVSSLSLEESTEPPTPRVKTNEFDDEYDSKENPGNSPKKTIIRASSGLAPAKKRSASDPSLENPSPSTEKTVLIASSGLAFAKPEPTPDPSLDDILSIHPVSRTSSDVSRTSSNGSSVMTGALLDQETVVMSQSEAILNQCKSELARIRLDMDHLAGSEIDIVREGKELLAQLRELESSFDRDYKIEPQKQDLLNDLDGLENDLEKLVKAYSIKILLFFIEKSNLVDLKKFLAEHPEAARYRYDGLPLFFTVVKKGSFEMIPPFRKLLSRDQMSYHDSTTRGQGRTALHVIVQLKRFGHLVELLSKPELIELNALDFLCRTPLDYVNFEKADPAMDRFRQKLLACGAKTGHEVLQDKSCREYHRRNVALGRATVQIINTFCRIKREDGELEPKLSVEEVRRESIDCYGVAYSKRAIFVYLLEGNLLQADVNTLIYALKFKDLELFNQVSDLCKDSRDAVDDSGRTPLDHALHLYSDRDALEQQNPILVKMMKEGWKRSSQRDSSSKERKRPAPFYALNAQA